MRTIILLAAALGVTMLGGCATYSSDGYYGYYDVWGYEGRGGHDGRDHGHARRSGGGRSEPGNESGMFPGRPGDGRGPSPGGGWAAVQAMRAEAKRADDLCDETYPMKKASAESAFGAEAPALHLFRLGFRKWRAS